LDLVSDDVVYLEDGDDLLAWGKPWRLRLLPEGVRLFPELEAAHLAPPRPGDDALELDVEAVFPGRTRACCRPEALLFIERSSGKPSLDELGLDRALDLLARDLVHDCPEALERHRRAWRRLANRGAFRFRVGSDLEAAVELLERFLDHRSG
jgi:hypothetical protein